MPLSAATTRYVIVAVEAHDLLGRRPTTCERSSAADEVVGDVEQAGDEEPVARLDFVAQLRRVGWRLLHDEAALRARRHDHRVLHLLRLHQPEHFGAEVFAAIRPANAAARDAPARRCTPSTRGEYTNSSNSGRGSGRSGTCAGSSFSTTHGRGRPSASVWNQLVRSVASTRCRSARRMRSSSRLAIASSAAVMLRDEQVGRRPVRDAGASGSKRVANRSISSRRDLGMRGERGGDVGLAERGAHLAEIAAVRAEQRDLAPRQPGQQHELVEHVVFGVARRNREERLLEEVVRALRRDRGPAQTEVLDPPLRLADRRDRVRVLVVDGHAHVREPRQDFGERGLRAEPVELEVEVAGATARAAPRAAARRGRRARSARRGRRGASVAGTSSWYDAGKAVPHTRIRSRPSSSPYERTSASRRSSVQARAAAATRGLHLVRRRPTRSSRRGGVDAEHVVQSGEHRGGESRVPLVARRVERIEQHALRCGRARSCCSDPAARTRGTTRTGRTARGARTSGPVFAPATPGCPSRCRRAPTPTSGTGRRAGSSRGSRSDPCSRGSRARTRARLSASETLRRRTGMSIGLARVRRRGVQPEKAVLADHRAAFVVALDADVVEVGRPVHRRARVRFRQHEQRAFARLGPDGGGQLREAHGRVTDRPAPARSRRMPRPVPGTARSRSPPFVVVREVVGAVAEEGEVLIGHPTQERAAFVELRRDRPGGGCCSSSRSMASSAASILSQSPVAARTSPSTRSRSARTASRMSGEVSRSTSMCTHDSRIAAGRRTEADEVARVVALHVDAPGARRGECPGRDGRSPS